MIKKYNLEQLKAIKEIIEALLKISSASIIKSNFIKAFYTHTNNNRLYGTLNLFGAKTFRLTSQNPNLLNLPSTGSKYAKSVKECFIAPKGYIIYQVDLSALEDRVIANLSKDKNKLAVFLNNVDGHTLNSIFYDRTKWNTLFPMLENETDEEYAIRAFNEIEKGNKTLKAIRQYYKSCTFALNYGAYPPKIAIKLNCPVGRAEQLWKTYNNELYPDLTKFKEKVMDFVEKNGYIHLGLGCKLYSDNIDKDNRTLFNACSQFWSILTLLTIHDLHVYLKENNISNNDVQIISTIYDSIYILIKENVSLIKQINDFIIPKLTKDFIENQIVHNEAEGEIGYDWYNTIKIPNNASKDYIGKSLSKLYNTYKR